jgi:hypothetical protein
MQVDAAVVQMVELALIGQGERLEVTQFVVAVLQEAGAVGFTEQPSAFIVAVLELLFLA